MNKLKRERISRLSAAVLGLLVCVSSANAAQTLQAENAKIIHHGIIETEHGGTGSGYVNLDNEIGSYAEFAFSIAEAGQQTLTFHYAYASAPTRSMNLILNGTQVSTLDFPATGAWTTWLTHDATVDFVQGINVIRLESATVQGGPNLDKIDFSGSFENVHLLKYTIVGEGSVSGADSISYQQSGSSVTLTASADAESTFGGWRGAITSSEPEINLTINDDTQVNAIFLAQGIYANLDESIGWCNEGNPVTGGGDATPITVTTQAELASAISGSTPAVVIVQGTIEITPFGHEIPVGSNKTILGHEDGAVLSGGGFLVRDVENVTIRYLTFKDAYVDWEGKTTDNDAIEINNSTNVWVDHCDLSHFDDGLIDIKNGADFVTVSWCHFHNHNKVMLIGSGDDSPQDVGHLNSTIHHCWFDGSNGAGIGERLPRVRFGKVHVYNNYYNDVLGSGVMAGIDGDVYVENNYFLNVPDPHPVVGGAGGGDNVMNADGNIFVSSGSRRDERGTSFRPSDYYTYEAHDAEDIPILVQLGAGIVFDSEIGSEVIEPPLFVADLASNQVGVGSPYPNPTFGKALLPVNVSEPSQVSITFYDIEGKKAGQVETELSTPGIHELQVLEGVELIPGIYAMVVFITGNSERILESRKLVIR